MKIKAHDITKQIPLSQRKRHKNTSSTYLSHWQPWCRCQFITHTHFYISHRTVFLLRCIVKSDHVTIIKCQKIQIQISLHQVIQDLDVSQFTSVSFTTTFCVTKQWKRNINYCHSNVDVDVFVVVHHTYIVHMTCSRKQKVETSHDANT